MIKRFPSGCLEALLEELSLDLIIARIPTMQAVASIIKSIKVAIRSAVKAMRFDLPGPEPVRKNQWQKATTERDDRNKINIIFHIQSNSLKKEPGGLIFCSRRTRRSAFLRLIIARLDFMDV